MFVNKYSTHIPILASLFKAKNIDFVFEFGPGSYSTKFFELNAKKTISLEFNDERWYNKIKAEIDASRVETFFVPGVDEAIKFFIERISHADLIFIDGGAESRVRCIEESFGRSSIIVTHDTESFGIDGDLYNWNTIKMNKEYKWIDITEYDPWTSVITNDNSVVDIIFSSFNKSQFHDKNSR